MTSGSGRGRHHTFFVLVTLLVGSVLASQPEDETLWRLTLQDLWNRVGMSEKATDHLHVKVESELLHPYSSGCLINTDLFEAADLLYSPEHPPGHEPHKCYFGSCSKQQEISFSDLYSSLMECASASADAPHEYLKLVNIKELVQQKSPSAFVMEACAPGVHGSHHLPKYELAPTTGTPLVITLTPDQFAKASPLPNEFKNVEFIRAVGRNGEEHGVTDSLGVDLSKLTIHITLSQFYVQHIQKPPWFDQRALNSTVALFGVQQANYDDKECGDAVASLRHSFLPHALVVAMNPRVTLTFEEPAQYRNVKHAIMQGKVKEFVVGFLRFSDHAKNVLIDDNDDALKLSLNITTDEVFHVGTVYRKLVQASNNPSTSISVGFDRNKRPKGLNKKQAPQQQESSHFVQVHNVDESTVWQLSMQQSVVGAKFHSLDDIDISLKLDTKALKIASAIRLSQLYQEAPSDSLGFTSKDRDRDGLSPPPVKTQILYDDVARLEQADYSRADAAEQPPTRANIWKKDPTVHFLGIRPVVLSNRVLRTRNGPSDDMFVVLQEDAGQFNIPLDADNNMIVQFDESQPLNVQNKLFDAVHTWAVARMVIEMYQRDFAFKLRDVHARIRWIWQREGDDSPLYLIPHAGMALNAKYTRSRKSIEFYYTTNKENGELVFFCRSLDVVAHEVTHAIIDGIKPAWMGSKKSETLALHEALSDLTPLFLSLSMMDVVETAITKSKNNLKDPKFFLPEVAIQVGALLNYQRGLRNANNNLTGSSHIGNTHELAQVFTGFVYDVLVDAFEETRMPEYVQDAFSLYVVSERLRRIMAFATLVAPDEDASFVDIAQGMIQAVDGLNYNKEWKQWIKKHAEQRELDKVQAQSFSFAPDDHKIGCAEPFTTGDFVPAPSPFSPHTGATVGPKPAKFKVAPMEHIIHHTSRLILVAYYLLFAVPIFILLFIFVDVIVHHDEGPIDIEKSAEESWSHLVLLMVTCTAPIKTALGSIKEETSSVVAKIKNWFKELKEKKHPPTVEPATAADKSGPGEYFNYLVNEIKNAAGEAAGHLAGKKRIIKKCSKCNNDSHVVEFVCLKYQPDLHPTLIKAMEDKATEKTVTCTTCGNEDATLCGIHT